MNNQMSFLEKRTHHAARYTNSKRLQKVLRVLSDGNWHTSLQIAIDANVLNPSGCISELNAPINALGIEKDEKDGKRYGKYRWPKK